MPGSPPVRKRPVQSADAPLAIRRPSQERVISAIGAWCVKADGRTKLMSSCLFTAPPA